LDAVSKPAIARIEAGAMLDLEGYMHWFDVAAAVCLMLLLQCACCSMLDIVTVVCLMLLL